MNYAIRYLLIRLRRTQFMPPERHRQTLEMNPWALPCTSISAGWAESWGWASWERGTEAAFTVCAGAEKRHQSLQQLLCSFSLAFLLETVMLISRKRKVAWLVPPLASPVKPYSDRKPAIIWRGCCRNSPPCAPSGCSPLVTTSLQKEASAWLVFTWEDSTWAKQAVFMSPSDHWGPEEL